MKYVIKLALLLVFFPQLIMAGDSPPNILLIITDQHTGSTMTQACCLSDAGRPD